MTWLWRICFSALLLANWPGTPLGGSVVRGAVEVVGARDRGVRRHKDYSGVVIWLEPAGAAAPSGPAPGGVRPFEMRQKDKQFVPHVLAIPVGGAVAFPNLDPIFHNAFSNFNGQIFDVGLYRPGSSRTVRFLREGVVRVFCNIHPTMSAVIVVLKNPYFAVSGSTGAFEIADVPAGEYRMHVFHERASAESLQSLERRVVVEDGGLQVPPFKISEAGYLSVPHVNKYGKPYPPVIDDHRPYAEAEK